MYHKTIPVVIPMGRPDPNNGREYGPYDYAHDVMQVCDQLEDHYSCITEYYSGNDERRDEFRPHQKIAESIRAGDPVDLPVDVSVIDRLAAQTKDFDKIKS